MRNHLVDRSVTVLALALLLVGALALPALASAEVRLTEDGFSPRTVRVDPGEEIIWVNATDEEQTVVGEDGSWDSGPLQPGETFSVALRDSGTFSYSTAEGDVEGRIRVRPPADEVAAEATEEPEAASLPQTGRPGAGLIGWALLLVGLGFLAFDRAQILRARFDARYGTR